MTAENPSLDGDPVNMFRALFVASALSLVAVACGGAPSVPATPGASGTPTAPGAAVVKQPGEAAVGDKTLCPVSKEEFTVTASSPKVDYKGKTYYFCCGGCDAKFKENPEKFLGGGKS
jgi:Cu+-exporting ATPase